MGDDITLVTTGDTPEIEAELVPTLAELGISESPYSALASGFLTGKYRTKADLEGAQRGGMAEGYFSEDGLRVVEAVERIAADRGVEMPTVALAWLLARGITAPICRPEGVTPCASNRAKACAS